MDIFSIIALIKSKSGGGSGSGGSTSAVTYTPQTLTTNQKTQARQNIDAYSTAQASTDFSAVQLNIDAKYTKPSNGIPASDLASNVIPSNILQYVEQDLTYAQMSQARENIYAASISELDGKADKIPVTTLSVTDGAIGALLKANTMYIFDGDVYEAAIAFRTTSDPYNQYSFIFTTGNSIPQISLPSEVVMPDYLTFKSEMRYEVDIYDNYAVVAGWSKR